MSARVFPYRGSRVVVPTLSIMSSTSTADTSDREKEAALEMLNKVNAAIADDPLFIKNASELVELGTKALEADNFNLARATLNLYFVHDALAGMDNSHPQTQRQQRRYALQLFEECIFFDASIKTSPHVDLQKLQNTAQNTPLGFLRCQTPHCFIDFWRFVESEAGKAQCENIHKLKPKTLFKAYGRKKVSVKSAKICGNAFMEALQWVTDQAQDKNTGEKFIADRYANDRWIHRNYEADDSQRHHYKGGNGGVQYEAPFQLAVELCIKLCLRTSPTGSEFNWQFEGSANGGYYDICFEHRECCHTTKGRKDIFKGVRRVVLELKVCQETTDKLQKVRKAQQQLRQYLLGHYHDLLYAHATERIWKGWTNRNSRLFGHIITLSDGKIDEPADNEHFPGKVMIKFPTSSELNDV